MTRASAATNTADGDAPGPHHSAPPLTAQGRGTVGWQGSPAGGAAACQPRRVAVREPDYATIRSFVERWASGTLVQCDRLTSAVEEARKLDWAHERGENWSPPWEDVLTAYDRVWVEAHLLVVAGHQLQTWTMRWHRQRPEPSPTISARLTALRNSLEHLDQALLDDVAARPDPALGRKSWALDRLPDGQLPLFPSVERRGDPVAAFGLLDVQALRAHAERVSGDIDDERYVEEVLPAVDDWVDQRSDEMRGG
ncbi:MAG: hypothetical protein JWP11_3409 [Frankiales bacterium]|nr:hypothetical protein [Frankiales bacterium]